MCIFFYHCFFDGCLGIIFNKGFISNNLGGGYYKFNTILFEDDTYATGRIIYNNSNYVYMIEEEKQLSQYPIERIKRYVISEKANKDSSDCKEFLYERIDENDLNPPD